MMKVLPQTQLESPKALVAVRVKSVLDSKEDLTLKVPLFGGSITFNLISPPQIDSERAF